MVIEKMVVSEKEERGLKERVGRGMEEGEGLLMIVDGERESVGD